METSKNTTVLLVPSTQSQDFQLELSFVFREVSIFPNMYRDMKECIVLF